MKFTYKFRGLLLLATVLFCVNGVFGQDTTFMAVTGHKDTTASHVIVYDDGGKEGNYSSQCDATYTIKTVNPANRFLIKVHTDLHYGVRGIADLMLSNGEEISEPYMFESCNETIEMMYSDSSAVTIKFKCDDSNPQSGFWVELLECSLAVPTDIEQERIDSATLKISWTEPNTSMHWVINYTQEYLFQWSTPGTNLEYASQVLTAYSDTNYIILTNLDPHLPVSYHIYIQDDNGSVGCGGIEGFCPCYYPDNLAITYDSDSVYLNWDESDTSIVWTVYIQRETSDTVFHIDTNYYAYPLLCENKPNYMSLHGNCDRYTDYFGHVSSECNLYQNWSRQEMLPLCPDVEFVKESAISKNSLTVVWFPIDTVDDYVVGYRKESEDESAIILYDTLTKLNTDLMKCTIDSLEENTTYIITVFTMCEGQNLSCGVPCRLTTTFDNCIEYTNITGMSTYLTWGDYDDPYKDTTINNYRYGGNNDWFWGTDRHTVFTDTNAYDWRTGWMLRQIPQGEPASVRLGNDQINREAESIAYEYTVDTNEYDMLVLKYAVVMQDPGHTKENQPRFTLEILDQNGGVIDTTCCFADFYAAGDLGWNEVEESSPKIIWKDWTTVGIDIAPYQDQTIRIRLTTYDCDEGGHFGYAYFTIKCDNKKIYVVNRCDALDSVWLQAPLGFDYYWHKQGETDTLSKSFEVCVPVDNNTYECVTSFVGKPECNFTISTIPVSVTPVSQGSFEIDTCLSKVTFVNTSYIDFDETSGAVTRQFKDSVYWIFEDGSISYDDTVARYYPVNGTYDIKLVSKLSESRCRDTLHIPLVIDFHNDLVIVGKDTVCYDQQDTLTLQGMSDKVNSFLWSTGQDTESIVVSPLTDTTYFVYTQTKNGCMDSASKRVVVNPVYSDTISAVIIQGQTYNQNSFTEKQSGTYTNYYTTKNGCDSIVTLNLNVLPVYDTTINASICEGSVYIYKDTFYYSEQGTFIDTIIRGDYANIYTFNIIVNPVKTIEKKMSACVGDTVQFNGQNVFRTGTYMAFLQTEESCDSIVMLDITFNYITHSNITVNICPNKPYELSNQTIYNEGLYFDTLQTAYGCDSVVHVYAVMNESKDTSFAITICEGEQYDFCGDILRNQGSYSKVLTTEVGCDSTVSVELNVIPTVTTQLTQSICENETYIFNSVELNKSGFYTDTLVSAMGCDSVVMLNLKINPLHYTTTDIMLKQGDTILLGDMIITKDGQYSYTFKSTEGCDSLVTLNITCVVSGLQTVDDTLKVLIYPNPTQNTATLELDNVATQATVKITDIYGKLLQSNIVTPQENKVIIDLGDMSDGVYYVTIYYDGYMKTKTLLKVAE